MDTTTEALQPSADSERILRANGWSPEGAVDISDWVDTLHRDGHDVFPAAKEILRRFGHLHLKAGGSSTSAQHAVDVDPALWYHERERVQDVEGVTGTRACPLGEVYGGAMLAVLEDGRVVSDLSGDVALLGENWHAALDLLVLGRGSFVMLAQNYIPIENE